MKKVRLKLKKKNALIALGILLLIIIEIINPSRMIAISKLKNKGYSDSASREIIRQGLKSKVLETDYNKFIELNISDEHFNSSYYSIYSELDYEEKIDLDLVNQLIEKE